MKPILESFLKRFLGHKSFQSLFKIFGAKTKEKL